MFEAFGLDRKAWWCDLTMRQVELRLHVAEQRLQQRARMHAQEIARDAIDILKALGHAK